MVERMWPALVDLVVPLHCGGCARPGTRWCRRCAASMTDAPVEIRTRVSMPVPAYALGRYTGVRRQAILELKERGRRDLAGPLGHAVAAALVTVDRWSELPPAERLILIPAPTRRMSARRRGGDPVTAIADCAAGVLGARVAVRPALFTSMWARDSARLSAGQRSDNLSGAIRMRRGVAVRDLADRAGHRSAVVLLDDVLTTGATAAESVAVLAAACVPVHLVLVVAAA